MSIIVRRTTVGVLIVLAAVLGSLATRVSWGAAASPPVPTPTHLSQTNVTVHLKGGVTHTYADVSRIRLYDGARKFTLTVRGGKTHTFAKSFRSYTESFVQQTPTSGIPTAPPTGIPTGIPTGTPTGLPTGLATP